jgi:hypothetical protein
MNLKKTIAALTLSLLAGSAFAATTPAASSTPAATPAPAAAKPAHKAKAPALKCKEGEAAVKGKCEKKPKA